MKFVAAVLLALLIGAACRLAGVPLPAPQALIGALLVVTMSAGFVLADRWQQGRRR